MNLRRDESGTSLVEFALTLPFLIFFLIGIIEIGRYAYYSILAANAARAGVQYAAQNLTTLSDNPAIISAAVNDGQGLSNWDVTPSALCSVSGGTPAACSSSGSGAPTNTIYYVSVRVTGTFNSLLNYPGLPHSLPVSGNAIMRVESQ